MKKLLLLAVILQVTAFMNAQENTDVIPHFLTEQEVQDAIRQGFDQPRPVRGIETPPDYESLRTMAEWEEVQALVIGWEGFNSILKGITAAAKEECEVIILSENPSQTENYLTGSNGGPALDNLNNVTIIEADLNTIWARDYSATTVYANEVEDVLLVDWIYNRPRPDDDASPSIVAEHLGIPLHCTTSEPYDLMGTGGNWMSDGFGMGFSSELISEENAGGNTWWGTQYPDHSLEAIENIMYEFMGIETYVTMENLPYDGIHHIDMHMKLLDEETILMAEYPEGVADGPQIEANLEYVLSNYTSKWGTPFKVIRIPSPPQSNGNYPDENGWYLTYTNSLFVNNTVLVPTYYTQYDTTALRIYEEALPGYNIIGIDCDSSPNNIIALSGALHCITHEVGADDPLLISHQALPDTEDSVNPYTVDAYMNHRLGVVNANMYWKTDLGSEYTVVAMSEVGGNTWTADIPAQAADTRVYYYVEGFAADGKVQTRPMPAPEGYWSFRVGAFVSVGEIDLGAFAPAFPNPAGAITCVPLNLNSTTNGSLRLLDVTGREIEVIKDGLFPRGESKYFFDASAYEAGMYLLSFEANGSRLTQRVVIK